MRWSSTALASLAILFPLSGAAEGPGARDGEDAYRALLREHESVSERDADRRPDSPLWGFPARFLAFAEANRGKPIAVDALGWIIGHAGGGPYAEAGPVDDRGVVDAAIAVLARDHARDAAIGPICPDLANHIRSKAAEDLLRRVVDLNPRREVHGLACLSLARYLASLSEFGLQRRLNPSTGGLLDRSLAKRVRGSDPEAVAREAEEILGHVIEASADVTHQGVELGAIALAERDELRTLAIGRKAPEILGEDLDGKPMALDDERGKVLVLNFASHEYCGPCRALYPFERSLVERLKGRPFAFLGVQCDDHRDAVLKARDEGEITWRCWWDGGSTAGPIAARWHIKGWPTVFVIDHKGVIRYKGVFTDAMSMAVDALLKERERGALARPPVQAGPASPPAGGFDEVVRVAEAIPSGVWRTSALSRVAAARAESEGPAAARPIFMRALALARGAVDSAKDDRTRGFLLVRLALVQSEAGDPAGAARSLRRSVACAGAIEREAVRHDLLQLIAHVQAETGDLEGGKATAEASGPQRVGTLTDLALGRAKAGDGPGALSLLKAVGDGAGGDADVCWASARVLPEVALAQAGAGDRDGARRTIGRALAAFDRCQLGGRAPMSLPAIALAQAKAGDREGSRATFARALRDADDAEDLAAAECLAQVARAQHQAGDAGAARESLREASGRIAGLDRDPGTDDLLVRAFLDLGDLAKALGIAREARDEEGGLALTPETVRQLARAQVRSGAETRSLGWLTEAMAPELRASALLGAVEGSR